jgi:YjbE family integral membrane protein
VTWDVIWLAQLFDFAGLGGWFTQLEAEVQQPQFWVALTKIIWINVLLSGDNALVIALACRGLQPTQRVWGMILGAGVAVLLRVIFTGIVATLMELPYLKVVGGLALLVIAAKLLVPEQEDEEGVQAAAHLWAAVRIVAIADIIMSLDNVIAVAAAANGSIVLMVLGLAISIPMIVAGAAIIMALLDRLPALVWLGAALLGWIAGEVIATDTAVAPWLHRVLDGHIAFDVQTTSEMFGFTRHMHLGGEAGEILLALLGVVIVLVVGSIWRRRALREQQDHDGEAPAAA